MRTRAKAQAAGVAASVGRLRVRRGSAATRRKAVSTLAPVLALVSNQGQRNSWHRTSISLDGIVLGPRWSDLLAWTTAVPVGPATDAAASYHCGRSYSVSGWFTSHTSRTPAAFMKNASLRSSRNWWFPMMSQIAAPTVTDDPGLAGSSTANSFELILVPSVEMYLSSNVSVTNRRGGDGLSAAGVPANVVLMVKAARGRPPPLESPAIPAATRDR